MLSLSRIHFFPDADPGRARWMLKQVQHDD
jgi:hypothetical protein